MEYDDTIDMDRKRRDYARQTDRKLLEGIHTAVARLEGAMPHMATKDDVGRHVGRHVEKYHSAKPSTESSTKPSMNPLSNLPGGKGTRAGGLITIIGLIAYAVLKLGGFL